MAAHLTMLQSDGRDKNDRGRLLSRISNIAGRKGWPSLSGSRSDIVQGRIDRRRDHEEARNGNGRAGDLDGYGAADGPEHRDEGRRRGTAVVSPIANSTGASAVLTATEQAA